MRHDWSRGDTRIGHPFALGDGVVAYAACNHRGDGPASLVWTDDDGRTWDRSRLTDLAEPGHDLGVVTSPRTFRPASVSTANAFVLVLAEYRPGQDPDAPHTTDLTVVRVAPA